MIFDENIFPFTNLSSSAGVRYSTEVLLLPESGARSDSTVNDSILNTNAAPIVLLPFHVLQPQKIPALGSADMHGTEIHDDRTNTIAQPPAAMTGAKIQEALRAVVADIPPDPVADLPGVQLHQMPPPLHQTQVLCQLHQLHQLWFQRHRKMLTKIKVYTDSTVRYTNLPVSVEPTTLAAALTDPY
jgi:hypothetical protein